MEYTDWSLHLLGIVCIWDNGVDVFFFHCLRKSMIPLKRTKKKMTTENCSGIAKREELEYKEERGLI